MVVDVKLDVGLPHLLYHRTTVIVSRLFAN